MRLAVLSGLVGCGGSAGVAGSGDIAGGDSAGCGVAPDTGGALGEAPGCAGGWEVDHDPYEIGVLWEVGLGEGQYRADTVADINGDGYSDIFLVNTDVRAQRSLLLSGVDGAVLWVTDALMVASPTVAVDGDGDGRLEIVGVGADGQLISFRGDGTERWQSGRIVGGPTPDALSMGIADIGADGVPDLLLPSGVVEARSGAILQRYKTDRTGAEPWGLAVGDADLDGQLDIFVGCARYAEDGARLWQHDCRGLDIPMLIQADDDPDAEVLAMTTDAAFIYEADGALIRTFLLPDEEGMSSSVQHPCLADLDGDGIVEIIRHNSDNTGADVYAWHLDGTLMWSRAIPGDPLNNTDRISCAAFDFEADGFPEILLSEADAFSIVDGRTGDLLYQDDSRCGGTVDDGALIADIDGDGSAEIIDVNQDATGGFCGDAPVTVRVYRHARAGWPPASPVWPVAQNDGATLRPDGTLPLRPEPSWLTTRIVRGQPPFSVFTPDLRPVLTGTCVAGCEEDSDVHLSVALQNRSARDADAAPVALYALGPDSAPAALLYTFAFDQLPPQRQSPAQPITLPWSDVRYGVQLSVAADDCDPADNTLTWLPACP